MAGHDMLSRQQICLRMYIDCLQGDVGWHKAKHFCIALLATAPAPSKKLCMAMKMHLKSCTSVPFDNRTATFQVCCMNPRLQSIVSLALNRPHSVQHVLHVQPSSQRCGLSTMGWARYQAVIENAFPSKELWIFIFFVFLTSLPLQKGSWLAVHS